jgi:RHS repeat-associated protein
MSEIVEWVYRNGAAKDPLSCADVCTRLWSAEQATPSSGYPKVQELWDELGHLETDGVPGAPGTDLWGGLANLREAVTANSNWLTKAPYTAGWRIVSSQDKWLKITGPTKPGLVTSECRGEWAIALKGPGETIESNSHEQAKSPGDDWYLRDCGQRERVWNWVKEPVNPTGTGCGWLAEPPELPGWTRQEWWWNLCYEGFYEGKEALSKLYAQAYYKSFHFPRPEDWAHQILEGEGTHNFSTSGASDPGVAAVTSSTEHTIERAAALREWLLWFLEGKRGPNPLLVSEEEEFGSENEATPHKTKCLIGKPVNCATGNQTETQIDLAVGGRGPGLRLTRTYNSQLAATQNSPGSFGYGWTGPYSAHLEVSAESGQATVYQDNGSTVRFLPEGKAWAPAGVLVQATLATEGNAYVYTLPDQTTLHFTSAGTLTSEVDRNGNALTMNRNAEGRLESISDPAGRKLTLAYNAGGQVESATDPMGHTVKYAYEGGNLASVTEPGETSPRWRFKYDGSHELTTQTDGRGHAVTTEYDGSHRVVSQTDALERKRTWKYKTSESGTETTLTEPNAAVTVEQFNQTGLLTSVTRASGTPLAATSTYEYDGAFNLVAAIDPNKHTTKYGYDSAGNRTSTVDANEHETKWGYNATHDVTSVTTAKGEKTTIKRDSHGNAEAIERPAPGEKTQTTKYKYDSHGELELAEDALKRVWKYEYDSQGDRAAEIDPEGDKRTWKYDEDSAETSSVSPRGNVEGAEAAKFTTKVERDEQERPITVTDPLGHATKHKYDGNGNLEALTDANSHTTTYTYDADNEQTKVKAPNGSTTETEYDGEGHVSAQIDGNKHKTTYTRNLLGQVKEVEDPLKHKTTKEYDLAGNLEKLTDAAKRTTTYKYDPANQLTEVSYSDGKTHSVKSEYDADGDRIKMEDATGTSKYTYDQLDRLTESEDGHKDLVKYEYDLANQQTKITYPNGKSVSRSYDTAGRLEKVTDWSEHVSKFAYDPDSNLKAIAWPSGTSGEDKYGYNEADQLTKIEMNKGAESLASLTYARDNDGQLESTTQKGLPGEERTSYSYDENNRLTIGGASEYKYDQADNPTKLGAIKQIFNEGNEPTEAKQVVEGIETPFATYSYDELGERTKTTPAVGTATTYGYDQAGNLTSAERTLPAINDTYTYDGSGLRASQTISGTTTYMTWDVGGSLPLLINDGSNNYVYGPGGLPVEQVSSGGTVLYPHHDQQGSTRLLTGSTGAKEASFTYDAYGNQTEHTGTATTPLGYDGQYTSSDTGLIYLRARAYDPATAQFVTRDPLGSVTRTPYTYAGDNPVNATDPSGLLCIGDYCLGFHPVAGLEGGVNFLAGVANAAVSTVTLGNVNVPQPFCGGLLGTSYDIGGATAGVEAGVAGGVGVASGARALLTGVLVGGVKVAPIVAPLAGGAGSAFFHGVVQGHGPSASTAGTGVVGGLGGELATGFFPGTSANAVSGGIGAVFDLAW